MWLVFAFVRHGHVKYCKHGGLRKMHNYLLQFFTITVLCYVSTTIESTEKCGEMSLVGVPRTNWGLRRSLKDGEQILQWDPMIYGYDGKTNHISVKTYSPNCTIQVCMDVSYNGLPECTVFTTEGLVYYQKLREYDLIGARCTCQKNSTYSCWKRTTTCPDELSSEESCRLYEGPNCDTCKHGFLSMRNGTKFSPDYQFRAAVLSPGCRLIYQFYDKTEPILVVYNQSKDISEKWRLKSNYSTIKCKCDFSSGSDSRLLDPTTIQPGNPNNILSVEHQFHSSILTSENSEATTIKTISKDENPNTDYSIYVGATIACVLLFGIIFLINKKYGVFKKLFQLVSTKNSINISTELMEFNGQNNTDTASDPAKHDMLQNNHVSIDSFYLDQLFSEDTEYLNIVYSYSFDQTPNLTTEISNEVPNEEQDTSNTECELNCQKVSNDENTAVGPVHCSGADRSNKHSERPWQLGMWEEVLFVLSQNHSVREITTDDLDRSMRRELGKGRYGVVEEWILLGSPPRKVAVKQVKPNAAGNYLAAIGEELKVLSILGEHRNIVELVGFHKDNLELGQLYLVLGMCENGSLKEYMAKKVQEPKPIADDSYCKIKFPCDTLPPESPIPLTVLSKWAYEIACGLDHLSSNNVVHLDIAARNVLLNHNLVCQVGDFGLSRRLDAESGEYSQKTFMNPVSYKWTALESLTTSRFTLQSDVWSYGVTLWEIYNVGELEPYPLVDDQFQLFAYLSFPINYRLPKPKYSSDEIYQQILSCWISNPDERQRCGHFKQFFSPYQTNYLGLTFQALLD